MGQDEQRMFNRSIYMLTARVLQSHVATRTKSNYWVCNTKLEFVLQAVPSTNQFPLQKESKLQFPANTLVVTDTHLRCTVHTIVCSRSVGRGLRAEVYVMVECSYFAYTSRLTVCP